MANQTKGGWALTVFAKRATGNVDVVADRGVVHPGDELRFALAADRPGHAAVLSADARGVVSVYAPPQGSRDEGLSAAGTRTLPQSIRADDTLGDEEIVAIRCDDPLDVPALRGALQAASAKPGTAARQLAQDHPTCAVSSLLLRKEPPPR